MSALIDTAPDTDLQQSEVDARRKRPVITPSDKNYVVAVSLAAIFGVLGIHHFYLGRYLEGLIDLGLAVLTFVLYLTGHPLLAILVFAIDTLHTFVVTIMLLIGSIKDGRGRLVCYPGQRLG